MGVRELWRLHGRRNSWQFQIDFLALRAGSAPLELDASEVLEGLTADDVREAAEGVRRGLTPAESIEAVARIVQRRQRPGARGGGALPHGLRSYRAGLVHCLGFPGWCASRCTGVHGGPWYEV